jgi:hypothetical protein
MKAKTESREMAGVSIAPTKEKANAGTRKVQSPRPHRPEHYLVICAKESKQARLVLKRNADDDAERAEGVGDLVLGAGCENHGKRCGDEDWWSYRN